VTKHCSEPVYFLKQSGPCCTMLSHVLGANMKQVLRVTFPSHSLFVANRRQTAPPLMCRPGCFVL